MKSHHVIRMQACHVRLRWRGVLIFTLPSNVRLTTAYLLWKTSPRSRSPRGTWSFNSFCFRVGFVQFFSRSFFLHFNCLFWSHPCLNLVLDLGFQPKMLDKIMVLPFWLVHGHQTNTGTCRLHADSAQSPTEHVLFRSDLRVCPFWLMIELRLNIQTLKDTSWYFILSWGPRSLARLPHI